MSFEDDLEAAKTALNDLFTSIPNLGQQFLEVIEEDEYTDGESVIDDIEDGEDSNIADSLKINDQTQLNLFCKVILQIFQDHNYDVSSFKQDNLNKLLLCKFNRYFIIFLDIDFSYHAHPCT